jgi:hypothetical protein
MFHTGLAELKAALPALRPVPADNRGRNAASIEYQTQNGTAVRVHTHFSITSRSAGPSGEEKFLAANHRQQNVF